MDAVTTRFHYLPETDNTVIERVQDCTSIVENAHQLRVSGAVGDSEMRHAARFPNVIVETYMNQRGISWAEFLADPVHVKQMLNDPALAAFRVWEGAA